MIKILLCDDHELFVSGLSELLKKSAYTFSVSYALNEIDCTTLLNKFYYDIFICDLHLKNADGFNLIEKNADLLSKTKNIFQK